ncbi:unnamed protein product [Rhizoctonia solani]|uniref:T6SS Phospholipase effector Tle1-like catalytic domain-containing protein n=1 Tax=Rhizoctonia solani TaxID=456999 RepID=A0A8H3HY20_9AGAM|nr:unnamed protein product [Rhizoctonia solani]
MSRINTFKGTFSRSVGVHFLGAWDTVSSIGISRSRLYHFTDKYHHITHFRHALALDERRVKFFPECVSDSMEGIHKRRNQTMKEVWFAGTHSDVGGGIRENPNLSSKTESLKWMLNEAAGAGLNLNSAYQTIRMEPDSSPEDAEVTESLVGLWWLLELIPTSWLSRHSDITSWRPHFGEGRRVKAHQRLHWSVLANHRRVINRCAYEPKASFCNNKALKQEWEQVFQSMSTEDAYLQWEGDTNSIKILELIKALDHQPLRPSWLEELLQHAANSDKAKLFWAYGGATFLKRVAETVSDSTSLGKFIKLVIGFKPNRETDLVGDESNLNSISKWAEGIVPSDVCTISGQFNGSDTDDSIDITDAIITRLYELMPLCEYHIPSLEASQNRPTSFFTRLASRGSVFSKSSGTSIKAALNDAPGKTSQNPGVLNLASTFIDMVSELLDAEDDDDDELCSYEKSIIIKQLPGLLPVNATHTPSSGPHAIPDPSEKMSSVVVHSPPVYVYIPAQFEDVGALEQHVNVLEIKHLVQLVQTYSEARALLCNLTHSPLLRGRIIDAGTISTLKTGLTPKQVIYSPVDLIVTLASYEDSRRALHQAGVVDLVIQLSKTPDAPNDLFDGISKLASYAELMSPELFESLTEIIANDGAHGQIRLQATEAAMEAVGRSSDQQRQDLSRQLMSPLTKMARNSGKGVAVKALGAIIGLIENASLISSNLEALVQLSHDLLRAGGEYHNYSGRNSWDRVTSTIETLRLVQILCCSDEQTQDTLINKNIVELLWGLTDSPSYAVDDEAKKLVAFLRSQDGKLSAKLAEYTDTDTEARTDTPSDSRSTEAN